MLDILKKKKEKNDVLDLSKIHEVFHDDHVYFQTKDLILNEFEVDENSKKQPRGLRSEWARNFIFNLVYDRYSDKLGQPKFYNLQNYEVVYDFQTILENIRKYEPTWEISYGYMDASKFINDYAIQGIKFTWNPSKRCKDGKALTVFKTTDKNGLQEICINEFNSDSDLHLNAGMLQEHKTEREKNHKIIREIYNMGLLMLSGFDKKTAKHLKNLEAYRLQNPTLKSKLIDHCCGTPGIGKSEIKGQFQYIITGKIFHCNNYPAPTLEFIRQNEKPRDYTPCDMYVFGEVPPTKEFITTPALSILKEDKDEWCYRTRLIFIDDDDENVATKVDKGKLKSVATSPMRAFRKMYAGLSSTEECVANITILSNDYNVFNITPEDGLFRRMFSYGNYMSKPEILNKIEELCKDAGDDDYSPIVEIDGKKENMWPVDIQILHSYRDVIADELLNHKIPDDFYKLRDARDDYYTDIKKEILLYNDENGVSGTDAIKIKRLFVNPALDNYKPVLNKTFLELGFLETISGVKRKNLRIILKNMGYIPASLNKDGGRGLNKTVDPSIPDIIYGDSLGNIGSNINKMGEKGVWFIKKDKIKNKKNGSHMKTIKNEYKKMMKSMNEY